MYFTRDNIVHCWLVYCFCRKLKASTSIMRQLITLVLGVIRLAREFNCTHTTSKKMSHIASYRSLLVASLETPLYTTIKVTSINRRGTQTCGGWTDFWPWGVEVQWVYLTFSVNWRSGTFFKLTSIFWPRKRHRRGKIYVYLWPYNKNYFEVMNIIKPKF